LGIIFFYSVIEGKELNKPGIPTCGWGREKRTSGDNDIENRYAQRLLINILVPSKDDK